MRFNTLRQQVSSQLPISVRAKVVDDMNTEPTNARCSDELMATTLHFGVTVNTARLMMN